VAVYCHKRRTRTCLRIWLGVSLGAALHVSALGLWWAVLSGALVQRPPVPPPPKQKTGLVRPVKPPPAPKTSPSRRETPAVGETLAHCQDGFASRVNPVGETD
jgi:hypothetical protein